MPDEMTRDRPFNMRLTEDELLMARVLADARGQNVSDFFRTSLHDSFTKHARDYAMTKIQALETARSRGSLGGSMASTERIADLVAADMRAKAKRKPTRTRKR